MNLFGKNKPPPSVQLPGWLSPLPGAEPCGPNLEYDADYAVLISAMVPRGDTQYGDFIGTIEAPNWAEAERDCRRLLLRSRDITLAILFLRCRTRQAQAEGLREGLALLVALLERHAEQLHPQLHIDGVFDPAVRANALAALVDPEGLLADIREIAIAKSSVMRLQVRDVERAHAIPRPRDALPLQAVGRQLDHLRRQKNVNLTTLAEAADLIGKLCKLVVDGLGDAAPDLDRLTVLMMFFNAGPTKTGAPMLKESRNSPDDAAVKAVSSLPVICDTLAIAVQGGHRAGDPQAGRETALLSIQQSRAWFELHEPSSPVVVLLRQAERMVGKRFTELANVIPIDLLQAWAQE